MKTKTKRILMVLSLLLTLAVNFLANSLPLNQLTTGEISDRYPLLFTPAGYVFSIWGLIYLAMTAFAVYIFTPQGLADKRIDSISGWFIIANLFNTVWIFLWHYLQFPLTLVAILGLLVSLVAIYLKLGVGNSSRSFIQRLLVETPFSIYLGWATVAVVANVAQVLYTLGWRGQPFSQPVWTVTMLVVASVLGVMMIFIRKEVAYPLVLVWAFVGIWVKQSGNVDFLAMTALGLAIVLGVLSLGRWIVSFISRK